jgi:uncharacterized membrane protein
VVNAICGSGFGKRVGEPDMDGFRATKMDLINENIYLSKTSHQEQMNLMKAHYPSKLMKKRIYLNLITLNVT